MINKKGKALPRSILKRTKDWKESISVADKKNLSREFDLLLNCPICNAASDPLFKVQFVTYLECSNCRHLFLQQMPKEDGLIELYKNGNSSQSQVYLDVDKEDQLSKISDIMKTKFDFFTEVIVNHDIKLDQNSTWIDFGSGIGNFLSVVKSAGFKVLGIEIDQSQCEYAKKLGIETLNIFFDHNTNCDFINGVRVISMLNILEHAINPHKTYGNLLNKLKTDCLMLIEVPKSPSLSGISNAIGVIPTYRHATPSEHLNIFSENSMKLFLETYKFEIIGIWNFGSDAIDFVDTISEIFFNGAQIDKELFSEKFNAIQHWIDQFKFSDNMLVVAKKR